jgi:hypothetical protein
MDETQGTNGAGSARSAARQETEAWQEQLTRLDELRAVSAAEGMIAGSALAHLAAQLDAARPDEQTAREHLARE